MTRADRMLDAAKRLNSGAAPAILCRLPDGTERPMGLIEAMSAGAWFVRTLDGSHDYDELFIAALNRREEDFSDPGELAGQ